MVKKILRRRNQSLFLLASLLTTITSGCGGGGGSDGGSLTGELSFSVNWEKPQASSAIVDGAAAAFDTPIPPSVSAIRFLFRPAAPAPACCITVLRGSQAFTDRRLLLANVAAGPATLEVNGYPANFAPNAGVTLTCPTNPAGQGVPCSGSQTTLPSFGSDPIPVEVVQGERNVVDVDVHSLPFLLDLDPADGATVDTRQPLVSFAVVDAANDVDPDVNIRLRSLPITTQATILDSEECDDGDTIGSVPDCSEDGELEVRGYIITSESPQQLPIGVAELRIRASNTASPVRDMESNTTFVIAPEVTTTMESTTTTTSTSSTTTTIGVPETFCLNFSVSNAVDLVGISYNALYANTGGDFVGSGENVSCVSMLDTDAETTLTTFNNNEQVSTLSSAIISAETFSGPVVLARCEFEQVPPLNLQQMIIQVTEATAPDLSPANATVVVEETQCPL